MRLLLLSLQVPGAVAQVPPAAEPHKTTLDEALAAGPGNGVEELKWRSPRAPNPNGSEKARVRK